MTRTLTNLCLLLTVSITTAASLPGQCSAPLQTLPHTFDLSGSIDMNDQLVAIGEVRSGGGAVTLLSTSWVAPVATITRGPPWGGFGSAVALRGNQELIVGSSTYDDPGMSIRKIGAVAIYDLAGSQPVLMQQIVSPAPKDNGGFGAHVAVEGNLMAVSEDGVVHVYERISSYWYHVSSVPGPAGCIYNDATAIDIAGPQGPVLVGYQWCDQARLLVKTVSGQWIPDPNLPDGRLCPPLSGTWYGSDVAIDGNVAIVGASNDYSTRSNGVVHRFEYQVLPWYSGWVYGGTLDPGDNPGLTVIGHEIDLKGGRAVVARRGNSLWGGIGAAFVFEADRNWTDPIRLQNVTPGSFYDGFGFLVGASSQHVVVVGDSATTTADAYLFSGPSTTLIGYPTSGVYGDAAVHVTQDASLNSLVELVVTHSTGAPATAHLLIGTTYQPFGWWLHVVPIVTINLPLGPIEGRLPVFLPNDCALHGAEFHLQAYFPTTGDYTLIRTVRLGL